MGILNHVYGMCESLKANNDIGHLLHAGLKIAQLIHHARVAMELCYRALASRGGVHPLQRGRARIFFDLFGPILLYFRPSGILPIDPARRELQNPCGEMKIGDFFDF